MKTPVYLDHNATTPVDPGVVERMLPFFTEQYGNPSSKGHAFGWAADEAVAVAREEVATLVGAAPEEIVFTGGATEAINTAVKGVAAAYARRGRHVVTTQIEHSAVREACRAIERDGFEVTYVPVGPDGRIRVEDVTAALRDETILVAVMWANNETGVIQPVEEVSSVARERGALFLTDATQAVGKIPVDVAHADLLACSAHKFYGPKGTGALFARRRNPRVRYVPLLDGGGQEEGRRGGTLNVPGIVGMGAAAAVAAARMRDDTRRLQALRDRLEDTLAAELDDVHVHGKHVPRLPQTTSVRFDGVRAANLLMAVRELAVSAGSACSSGTGKPSRVLKAMGLTDTEALSTLRFSLGRSTTDEEVDYAIDRIVNAVRRLRANETARV